MIPARHIPQQALPPHSWHGPGPVTRPPPVLPSAPFLPLHMLTRHLPDTPFPIQSFIHSLIRSFAHSLIQTITWAPRAHGRTPTQPLLPHKTRRSHLLAQGLTNSNGVISHKHPVPLHALPQLRPPPTNPWNSDRRVIKCPSTVIFSLPSTLPSSPRSHPQAKPTPITTQRQHPDPDPHPDPRPHPHPGLHPHPHIH
jgi:hypothetical protein